MDKNWSALTEDEDDVFLGSPKSKFFDIYNKANEEVSEDVFDNIVEKFAIMEMFLIKNQPDFDLEKAVAIYNSQKPEELEEAKKSLYMEFTGNIVCRLDS